jgi:hypothetical protein
VIRNWRKLHNERLHDLYCTNKIKENEMGRTGGTNGEIRNVYGVGETRREKTIWKS